MGKSDRMYAKSPKMERGEDGKMGIKKPSKADGENMGIEGNEAPGAGDGMPVQTKEMHDRHMTEMKDMHARHEDEHKDMHKRHQKEVKDKSGTDVINDIKDTK